MVISHTKLRNDHEKTFTRRHISERMIVGSGDGEINCSVYVSTIVLFTYIVLPSIVEISFERYFLFKYRPVLANRIANM